MLDKIPTSAINWASNHIWITTRIGPAILRSCHRSRGTYPDDPAMDHKASNKKDIDRWISTEMQYWVDKNISFYYPCAIIIDSLVGRELGTPLIPARMKRKFFALSMHWSLAWAACCCRRDIDYLIWYLARCKNSRQVLESTCSVHIHRLPRAKGWKVLIIGTFGRCRFTGGSRGPQEELYRWALRMGEEWSSVH